jgi:hypothetical protein
MIRKGETDLTLPTSLAKRMITPTPLVRMLSAAKANITTFVIHKRKKSPLIRMWNKVVGPGYGI